MPLVRWFTKIRTFVSKGHAAAVPEILPAPQFRAILGRERSRADRVRSELSLLVLDLSAAQWGEVQLCELLFAIQKRVRDTDAVGWFDRHSVGILLPDTAPNGAYKLAADLRDLLHRAPQGMSWKIYCYPTDSLPGQAEAPREQRRATHSAPDAAQHQAPHDAASRGGDPVGRHDAPDKPARASHVEARAHSVAVAERPRASAAPAKAKLQVHAAVAATPFELEVEPLRPVLHTQRSSVTRVVDIAGSSLALIAFSPIMAAAAIAVCATSRGPIIFKQQRSGIGGKSFTFYKFRTMVPDAEAKKQELLSQNEQEGPVFKMARDPRITPVGRIMRKLSIDELPQLWNVLKGDMSIVGPRPPLPAEVAEYEAWQRRRLDIHGGLTCIWQISGRSNVQFDDWVRMDLQYTERNSVWLDLKILTRTPLAVLTGRGAR